MMLVRVLAALLPLFVSPVAKAQTPPGPVIGYIGTDPGNAECRLFPVLELIEGDEDKPRFVFLSPPAAANEAGQAAMLVDDRPLRLQERSRTEVGALLLYEYKPSGDSPYSVALTLAEIGSDETQVTWQGSVRVTSQDTGASSKIEVRAHCDAARRRP